VHPLAGQGLNLGVADAAALADAILRAAESGGDPGDSATLQTYASERQAASLAMQGIVDGIKRLYASGGADPSLFSLARTLGMGAFNTVEPLKREAVLFAMGGRGSLLAAALRAAAHSGPANTSRGRRGTFDHWI
jgi:2-polyprenyl-6-methoxyphenol hydroxylase-like FAD-dependent oxidoreductase